MIVDKNRLDAFSRITLISKVLKAIMDNKSLSAIFVGRSGTGKSKMCSAITEDEELFEYAPGGRNITNYCSSKTVVRFGVALTVVDTKGIVRLSENEPFNVKTIEEGLQKLTPGASAIVICIKMDRLEDELEVLKFYERNMGSCFTNYAVVVFTHLDQYKEKLREDSEVNKTLKEFRLTLPEDMANFLHKIDNRYLAFNNHLSGEEMDFQIQSLIEKIKQVREHNHGDAYSLEHFRRAQIAQPIEITTTGWISLGLVVVLIASHCWRST